MTARHLARATGSTPARDAHPQWCAQGHACGLGEHRAAPITLRVPGRASVVLTRVMSASGREHVEIRTSITLAPGEQAARRHLAHVLTELQHHLRRVIAPSAPAA